jgi:manganese transport protein
MNTGDDDRSLSDVHGSIDPAVARKPWRRIAAFFGPAYLVSVGYMDPGNWATDLQGGAQFGYTLIWVLLMSNLMALLLQSLSARLGIVQGRDLAQCNREAYPRVVNFALYVLAEIAIAATDLAEVLGVAIGLNLLLDIPLIWGVLITFLDTFILLYLQKLGMRKMEAFIITLVGIVGACFLLEMVFAKPPLGEIVKGFVPSIPDNTALYIAIGIIGATVMPHNLYLHSALVQTRKIKRDDASIKRSIKFNTWDSALALNMAFFVNSAILILAAAAFHSTGNQQVASLKDAHVLLSGIFSNEWASHLFAIALIAAGQSSTVTGTLAGQIVMEGYLRLRINPWMRRLLTRLLAIVPAVLVLSILGEGEVDAMLVFSQVLLSMQLAFAIIPLIHFVSDRQRMGKFTVGIKTKIAAWLTAAVIVVLNLKLVYETVAGWLGETENFWVKALIIVGTIAFLTLLITTIIYPWVKQKRETVQSIHKSRPLPEIDISTGRHFGKVALALDFSEKDESVIRYAIQLASADTEFVLIHIVESAPARRLESDALDLETRYDNAGLEAYIAKFREHGFNASGMLGYKNRAKEIARIVNETGSELLIVGSHGHKLMQDWIFGETINSVRHIVKVPIFIAR